MQEIIENDGGVLNIGAKEMATYGHHNAKDVRSNFRGLAPP